MNTVITQKQTSSLETPNQENFGDVGIKILASNCEHTISNVSMVLPNGINTHGRPIAGIDWSRDKVIVNEGLDKPVARFKTLAEAAPHYSGYIWALESTADSYELQNRQTDLEAIKAADIWAFCSNSKYTSVYRMKWNDIPKTDEADSEIIRSIFVTEKLTWSRLKQLSAEDTIRKSINKAIMQDRPNNGKQSIATAKKYLPAFKDTDLSLREMLYKPESIKPKNPRNPTPKKQIGRLIMAALMVREAGFGWRTLRRQVGNHGQGYACMLRSEFFWWLIRPILNARLKKAGIDKTVKVSHIDPKTKEQKQMRVWTPKEEQARKEVMREMNRILRWLWKLTENKV